MTATQIKCPGLSQVTAFWDIFLVFHNFCSFLLESHPFHARARFNPMTPYLLKVCAR